MGIITNTIKSTLGLTSDPGWQWREHIHAASFRGVPFGVMSGDGTFGRRVAVHEYPFRDSVYIEDLGRSTRRLTIRGFLVQESKVYQAGDVFTQRDSLIAACEQSGSGTLVHPTLGEITVYVPDGGLQINEGVESERVFEFTLTCMEGGEKAFSIQVGAESITRQSWLSTLVTIATRYVVMVKSEINSVAYAIRAVKSTTGGFMELAQSTLDAVSNLQGAVESAFGNQKYSRYNSGSIGGSVSGVIGVSRNEPDVANPAVVIAEKTATSVMDKNTVEQTIEDAGDYINLEEIPESIQNIIKEMAEATGSDKDKINAFETLSQYTNSGYQKSQLDKTLVDLTVGMMVWMSTSTMTYVALQYTPFSLEEAQRILERVCTALDRALLLCADLGEDECYQLLLEQRRQFVQAYTQKYASLSNLMQVSLNAPLPALLLANRLYQDATRSSELIQAANPKHPAFMPIEFRARKD
ncbi:DNA circularization N-terminal domain-containing protein [Saezia sanguinis]|uniref:DNA circularization N-terminal domain-containing protein n=1 Tax=Saezia sanguinis TaxID=1965230 RepID=UPI0030357855